jgi:hypothetical protein
MNKNNTSLIAIFFLIASVLACANSSDNPKVAVTQSNTNSLAATPSPKLEPEKSKEEKSFSFTVQGGKKITGSVFPNPNKADGKMIIFTPFLEKSDGNLYNAALNSLWSVYGKKRGLFQLKDAKLEFDSALGGNAICWDVFNPKQQFCVFPIKDSGAEELGSLHIWLK